MSWLRFSIIILVILLFQLMIIAIPSLGDSTQQTFELVWRSDDLGGGVHSVVWSLSGNKLVAGVSLTNSSGWHGRVVVFDANGTLLWQTEDLGAWVSGVDWSPDGNKLVAGGYFKRVIVFSSDGTVLWEKDMNGSVLSVVWSPDGSKIAVSLYWHRGDWYSRVTVFDANGEVLWVGPEQRGFVSSIAWSPGGDRLAVGVYWYLSNVDPYNYNSYVSVFDGNGSQLWRSRVLVARLVKVAWSPSGDLLAASTGWTDDDGYFHGGLLMFDSEGNLLWQTEDLGANVSCIAWSPSGDMLAAGIGWHSNWSDHGRILVFDKNGSVMWRTEDLGDSVSIVVWSPAGDRLAVGAGQKVFVFDSNGSQVWKHYPNPGDGVVNVVGMDWGLGSDLLAVGTSWGGHGMVFVYGAYNTGPRTTTWETNTSLTSTSGQTTEHDIDTGEYKGSDITNKIKYIIIIIIIILLVIILARK